MVLNRPVNESTVRSIRQSYEKRRRIDSDFGNSDALPKSQRGRPTKVGLYDEEIQQYIRKLRISGGVVNSRIVISAAKGFVKAKNKTLLAEYGGTLVLEKSWAYSIMKRMGLTKRKGTKGVKHLPQDFAEIQKAFIERIDSNRRSYDIPDELCINWDQTGCNYVPVSSWTMHDKGSKQVPIAQLDDKRQMTVLMACTKSGTLLPPQLLYRGKTESCHADYKFPDDWDVWHTETHWSNSLSMQRFMKNIIVPYVENVRDELDLPLKQRALCIFDIYKAHQGDELRTLLQKHNIQIVYIPASCTDRLQPLDLSVNSVFKQYMKACFEDWYSDEVASQLLGCEAPDVNVEMRLSTVKPIHAKWMVQSLQKIQNDTQIIKRGWAQAGIQHTGT